MVFRQFINGLLCIYDHPAAGIALCEIEVTIPHPAVEGDVLRLETVVACIVLAAQA